MIYNKFLIFLYNLITLDTIPDEETALQSGGPALPGQRQLPPNVKNQERDVGDGQKMVFFFNQFSFNLNNLDFYY